MIAFRTRSVSAAADRGAGEVRALLARLLVRRYLEKQSDATKRVAA